MSPSLTGLLSAVCVLTCALPVAAQAKPAPAKPAAKPAPKPAPKKPAPQPKDDLLRDGRTYVYDRFILRSKGKESHFFRVGHHRGEQLKGLINRMAQLHGIKGLQLDAYETDHLFVVTGPTESVRWAQQLMEGIDRPDHQVRIEALILEVEVGQGLETGLESTWDRKTADRTFFRGYDFEVNPESFLTQTTQRPFQGATGTFSTTGSAHQQARVGDLDLAIRAVQAHNRVDVLSRPSVLVKNGEKVLLSSGLKILIPTTVSLDQFNNPRTTLSQKDVSTKIEATPHIIGAHTVELDLHVTVQDLLKETPPEEIKTSQREIRTKVIVNEGENFLALGGLLRKRTSVVENGIPLLMDIPLLGYLFKSYTRSSTTTELNVYVRVFIERSASPESGEAMIIPESLRHH